jgi:hypothetical protein
MLTFRANVFPGIFEGVREGAYRDTETEQNGYYSKKRESREG